jgi:glycerol kinase
VIVLGLDQGTSSTRCVALDRELREVGAASVPVSCSFPAPGLVEQDPEELAESARAAIAAALGSRDDVAALGIANQTETFVVWDRESGRAVHSAIVWQDRRTDSQCAALREHAGLVRQRTGLELDATFPATKLRWLLDRTDGELAYGDVGSWLLHRLAGTHVTDAGNAARSLLCPLGGGDWDEDLLALFGVPRAILPPIVDTDAVVAALDARPSDLGGAAVARNGRGAGPGGDQLAALPARAVAGDDALAALPVRAVAGGDQLAALPVRAVAGDQQASLFGLRCWRAGEAKVTLGTGAFVLANAGHEPPAPPAGVLASTAWRIAGRTTFALEGFVPTAGAALDWFARIGALPAGPELDALLREASPGAGVVCVPALQGLGTPSWDASLRGAVFGIDLGTTRADLARAVVDGVLHQVIDALDVLRPGLVRLDGGLARSPWIVQRLADLSGTRIERTSRPDTTAIGAAMLAGLAAGVWESASEIPAISSDLVAEPVMGSDERAELRARWFEARERAGGSAIGG